MPNAPKIAETIQKSIMINSISLGWKKIMPITIITTGIITDGITSNLDVLIIIGNANTVGIKSKLKKVMIPNPPIMPEEISINKNIPVILPKTSTIIFQYCIGFLVLLFSLRWISISISHQINVACLLIKIFAHNIIP